MATQKTGYSGRRGIECDKRKNKSRSKIIKSNGEEPDEVRWTGRIDQQRNVREKTSDVRGELRRKNCIRWKQQEMNGDRGMSKRSSACDHLLLAMS